MNHVQIISDPAMRNYVLFNPRTTTSSEVYEFITIIQKKYPDYQFDVFYGGLTTELTEEQRKEDVVSLLEKGVKAGEVESFASIINGIPKSEESGVAYHWMENRTNSKIKEEILAIILSEIDKMIEKVNSTIKEKTRKEILRALKSNYKNIFGTIVERLLSTPPPSREGEGVDPISKMLKRISDFKKNSPDRYSIALKTIDREIYYHRTNKGEYSINYPSLFEDESTLSKKKHVSSSFFMYLYDLNLIAGIEGVYFSKKRKWPLVKNVVCYHDYKYNALLLKYLSALRTECFQAEKKSETSLIYGDILSSDWEIIDILFNESAEVAPVEGCVK